MKKYKTTKKPMVSVTHKVTENHKTILKQFAKQLKISEASVLRMVIENLSVNK